MDTSQLSRGTSSNIRLAEHYHYGALQLSSSLFIAFSSSCVNDCSDTYEFVGRRMAGTPTSFRPVFTIPPSADEGAQLIPNIYDPQAADAQVVCPGYKASGLEQGDRGLSATLTLAGAPCNAYGIDIEELDLIVEYQAKGGLAVNIVPKYLVSGGWLTCMT
jgi:alpha-glucosidase